MDYAVYTYGGGEVFYGVFNAVSSLVNSHSGKLYTPLIRLAALVGGFGAICGALWRQNPLIFLKDWLLPFYIILTLLFAPTASVMVIDSISKTSQKIDNIPWGLAGFAGTVSMVGHAITRTMEEVFSLPEDMTYQKTGTLFASRLMQNAKALTIINEDTRENMREFVGHCVVYDALLGSKYSLNDLKNSDNIWALVSQKASPARSFIYREPKQGKSLRPKPQIITCKEGVEKFNALFEKEIQNSVALLAKRLLGGGQTMMDNTLMRSELLRHLPTAYGYLLKSSKNAEEIVKQQMMMHAVVDGIEYKSTSLGNPPNFAAKRAYLQQRSTYQTLGEMAADNLPIMKNVIEALAYAAFLFVIPLTLLPQGWSVLSSWAGIVIWLQMWAPLYAVLNFVMNVTARAKNLSFLGISSEEGLTLANASGLYNLNADMSAMAGYLSMSIPFIAYALVKGGVGSFVHLASHLSNVSQGAASQAATEATTGNYSFGNISMGNQHLNTIQAHQTNMSASYQAGGFRQSDGKVEQITSAQGDMILNVASSQLPSTITSTESDTNMLSRQASLAATAAESQSLAASKSEAEANRLIQDLSLSQSRGTSASSALSSAENAHYSKSFDTMKNIVENFSSSHGLSDSQSSQILASVKAGMPFKEVAKTLIGIDVGVGWNGSSDAKRQEVYDHAKNITQQSDYKEALSTGISYIKDNRFGDQDEASKRNSESINANLERSQQYREEANASFQKAQIFNEAAAWSRQNSMTRTHILNDEYIAWLQGQSDHDSGAPLGKEGAIEIIKNQPDTNRFIRA